MDKKILTCRQGNHLTRKGRKKTKNSRNNRKVGDREESLLSLIISKRGQGMVLFLKIKNEVGGGEGLVSALKIKKQGSVKGKEVMR